MEFARQSGAHTMDMLINLANILYVVAYFTLDMLRLRLLTTMAAICLAVYFYNQSEPMLNVVAWNLFFVSLNMMQIVRIVRARLIQRNASGLRSADKNLHDGLGGVGLERG